MIEFHKYHAVGNGYIVIDPNVCSVPMTKEIFVRICNRNTGIGADGVLWGPTLDKNRFFFRIYNPDGSEAERSGNGIRIFGQYLYDKQYTKKRVFDIYTASGIASINILERGMISTLMGTYSSFCKTYTRYEFHIDNQVLEGHYMNVGNPHCAFFMQSINSEKIERIGALISTHQIFPDKTNVQIVHILDRESLELQIWERGAGYTLASGTSSIAVGCIAYMLGLVTPSITLKMPGGILSVNIDKDKVFLTGPTVMIAHGFFYGSELNTTHL